MEWTARLVRTFEGRMQRRMSLNKLSTLLGRASTFLFKVLDHPRGPRVGDLFEAQLAAGDEMPGDLYHQAFEKASNDPLLILACNRRRQGLPPNEFLKSIAPRILDLVNAGPSHHKKWRSRLETLRSFEGLLERNRKISQEKLEWAVTVGVNLFERSAKRPPSGLGDLAFALASLSVALRLNGELDDALDALLLAFPLVKIAEVPLVEGLWYQRSAYLLVRLARYDRAAEFVKESAIHFIAASAHRELARSLVDLGHVLSLSGQGEEARKQVSRALLHLQPTDKSYRCSAHQILAEELVKMGKLGEAEAQLNEACALAVGNGTLLGSLYWSQAKLFIQQRAKESAARAFQEALQLQLIHGSPPKVASLTFEYAALLLETKNRPELEKLAALVLRYFAKLGSDSELREAIEDLAARLKLDRLDLQSLRDLRNRLPQPVRDDSSASKAQPTGSIRDPISGSSPMVELLFDGKLVAPKPTAG